MLNTFSLNILKTAIDGASCPYVVLIFLDTKEHGQIYWLNLTQLCILFMELNLIYYSAWLDTFITSIIEYNNYIKVFQFLILLLFLSLLSFMTWNLTPLFTFLIKSFTH